MATSFSGGRGRNTRIEPPTMGKQLVKSLAAASRVHIVESGVINSNKNDHHVIRYNRHIVESGVKHQ
jgi:hypothetical protein